MKESQKMINEFLAKLGIYRDPLEIFFKCKNNSLLYQKNE